jgi:hypothetical protein
MSIVRFAGTVGLSALVLVGCGSDVVTQVASEISPDGQAVAVYSIYEYGGAGGGVGHCVSIMPVSDLTRDDCALLASRGSSFKIAWRGTTLVVKYKEAHITKFTNEVYVSEDAGPGATYEIELMKEPR